MKARSAKAKGRRLEQAVADAFCAIGWKARRQPGSGIYEDFPHDVYLETDLGDRYIVEAKSWKAGWRTGDKAMGAADMLVIRRDRGEACVYMPLATFCEVVTKYQGR